MDGVLQSGIFAGGEQSGIELLHALILLLLVGFSIRQFIHHYADAGSHFALASLCVGLIVFMFGRELSFGKYHGVEHATRTALRGVVYSAILTFWIFAFYRLRARAMPVITTSVQHVLRYKVLAFCVMATLALSQLIDKDVGYAIQPPALAQLAEELLETVAYVLLGLFLWRLLRNDAIGPH